MATIASSTTTADRSAPSSEIELNEGQAEALRLIHSWYSRKETQEFYLAGYAGTGKTELVKAFIRESKIEEVLFAAFTGKAASVLGRRVGQPAYTIHQTIYKPSSSYADELRVKLHELKTEPDQSLHTQKQILDIKGKLKDLQGQMKFSLRQGADLEQYKLLAIDEVSMVNDYVAEDLRSFGRPMLVLGDPAQLPPVRGAGAFTRRTPDAFLTHIERQAADHPIIAMSQMARNGEEIPIGKIGSAFEKAPRGELTPEELFEANQVLCGTNSTRRKMNRYFRTKQGYRKQHEILPQKGERLICCQNNHNLGLLNGVLYTAINSAWDYDVDSETFRIDLVDELGNELYDLEVSSQRFEQYTNQDAYLYPRDGICEFDFGYAITVHKAQGSEWDSVVLLDDWFSKEYSKWLYTGITRARSKLKIVGDR